MAAEVTTLDISTVGAVVGARWLHELLTDLLMVERPISAILMNSDNQTVIAQ
jgi:hypothetical protein